MRKVSALQGDRVGRTRLGRVGLVNDHVGLGNGEGRKKGKKGQGREGRARASCLTGSAG